MSRVSHQCDHIVEYEGLELETEIRISMFPCPWCHPTNPVDPAIQGVLWRTYEGKPIMATGLRIREAPPGFPM